jgi:hypothetical protein
MNMRTEGNEKVVLMTIVVVVVAVVVVGTMTAHVTVMIVRRRQYDDLNLGSVWDRSSLTYSI